MDSKVSIVWFRNDLRLHDNEAFFEASSSSQTVIPVYIFDPRVFESKTKFGFAKTGKFRLRFILESITDLKKQLQQQGSDLIIRIGEPENVLPDLSKQFDASWIFCNRERTDEEVKVQDSLEKTLWTIGREIRYSRGKMLYYTADLPFPVTHTPDTFTSFRKEVEKFIPVRKPIGIDRLRFSTLDFVEDLGAVPSLESFGVEDFEIAKGMSFTGGETEALNHLAYYFSDQKFPSTYKETRNQLLGKEFSTKFSVYLSTGCLSPKMAYHQLKEYEAQYGANESTYWIFFELLWRDFFRLMGKKHGNKIFKIGGIVEKDLELNADWEKFNKWSRGETGMPFIDANMRELNTTGFMSNRGRQNTASYLIKDLGLNWLMGAEYFESLLIDYDPCSNYGNWNYIAGVGCDPREQRYFNILSQAKRYDPKGTFVRYWLPELINLPDHFVHNPDQMNEEDKAKYPHQYFSSLVPSTMWSS